MKGISTVLGALIFLAITIALAVIGYIYAENFLRGFTPTIRLLDAQCEPNVGFGVIVKNLDPRLSLDVLKITVLRDREIIPSDQIAWTVNPIPNNGGISRGSWNDANAIPQTRHYVKVIGPSNSEEDFVEC
ncbi:MAG: archaellin/type IV pilin N-terminal domain-containing protein [Candidatus Aenigmatarchaeota archaeon]